MGCKRLRANGTIVVIPGLSDFKLIETRDKGYFTVHPKLKKYKRNKCTEASVISLEKALT